MVNKMNVIDRIKYYFYWKNNRNRVRFNQNQPCISMKDYCLVYSSFERSWDNWCKYQSMLNTSQYLTGLKQKFKQTLKLLKEKYK